MPTGQPTLGRLNSAVRCLNNRPHYNRRLNIVYDRAPDLFAAHVWIAMISIISRRLVAETQPR
jgi:hypothetical protein